ncbi:MAG: hypothetical protein JO023_07185 [Chloroflexi bacterium]|nr:hypothetical protein [Chloroflexota bacterium]
MTIEGIFPHLVRLPAWNDDALYVERKTLPRQVDDGQPQAGYRFLVDTDLEPLTLYDLVASFHDRVAERHRGHC